MEVNEEMKAALEKFFRAFMQYLDVRKIRKGTALKKKENMEWLQ